MNEAGEEFWSFSVAAYGKPSVAEGCLWLQDEFGIDVNMLLVCCWYGRVYGEFDETRFRMARDFSSRWRRSVVGPLRNARRWMKSTGCNDPNVDHDECMELRERVKAIELDAERMQQQVLAGLVGPIAATPLSVTDQLASAVSNLRRFLESEQVGIDDRVAPKLLTLLEAAIDGVNESSVEFAMQRGFDSKAR